MRDETKLSVAITLLEHGVSLHKIRSSSPEELQGIAQQCGIGIAHLDQFAEEVGQRSRWLARVKAEERKKAASTTVLFTDDTSVRTDKMAGLELAVRQIADERFYLESGYFVQFRVRNAAVAALWSQALGVSIEPINDPLPVLTDRDCVVLLYSVHTPDVVQSMPYVPD